MLPGLIQCLERLWAAVTNRDRPSTPVPAPTPPPILTGKPTPVPDGLDDRDQRIAVMQQEYARLEEARDRAVATAGQEQLEKLFSRLSSTLSNLAALSDLAQAGQSVAEKDLLTLVRSLFRDLEKAGLEPVGRVGDTMGFDPALHQRMSGGSVYPGVPVVIELPGFRVHEKILLKAMVSTKGV